MKGVVQRFDDFLSGIVPIPRDWLICRLGLIVEKSLTT
jgi:hypothetical protein